MTREEINKLNPSQPCIDIAEEERWYEMGLIEGLEAADKEPNTSVLWHKQNEEPEEGKLIVCIDEDSDLYSGAFYDERVDDYNRVYESAVWDYGTLICYWDDVKMWAYTKDLLPKGSEK